MSGRLVLMGSGELAPTMVGTHRDALIASEADEVVVLDTPFGFQENADDLTARILEHFETSLNTTARVVSLRSTHEGPASIERMLAAVRRARFVFAGPGSPSYALGVWEQSGLADALVEMVSQGGAVVFSSAAALTAGIKTIPVYEIYKAGADPFWLDGMDLGSAFGLPMTVVPHWNNADGGTHDTSRCYIGQRRLAQLAGQLDHGILGIDEHSSVTIDFANRSLHVAGVSGATLHGIENVTLEPDSSISLDEAAQVLSNRRENPEQETPQTAPEFVDALEAGNLDQVIEAALGVEADTAAGADRSALRSVIVELGEAARSGLADPRDAVGGFVETLLELRARARSAGRYDESDLIRDRLAALGVEVRDTPDGTEWSLD